MKPTCTEYLPGGKICGQPAVKKVVWPGCKFCGGSECGDSYEVDYLCVEHAAGEDHAVDLIEEDEW